MPTTKGQNVFNFIVVFLSTVILSLLFYVRIFNPDILNKQNITKPEIKFDQNIIDNSIQATVTIKGQKLISSQTYSESCGSGFFISPDGLILTNQHVINDCNYLFVIDHTGQKYKAEVISGDKRHDLAVLKINKFDNPYLNFYQHDKLSPGQPVAAIGNPYNTASDGKAVVTLGRISRLQQKCYGQPDFANDRFYDNLIQIDAAVYPGNSGGPLVDASGNVIGVITATANLAEHASVGFAITTNNNCREIIHSLASGGTIQHGFLGTIHDAEIPVDMVNYYNLSDLSGAYVSMVLPGSPAQKAGICQGDIIKQIDNVTINDRADLIAYINKQMPNSEVEILVKRPLIKSLKDMTLTAKLEKRTLKNRNGYFEEINLPETSAWGITVKPVSKWRRSKSHIPEKVDGVLVYSVSPDTKLKLADIQPGDVITHINNQPIRSLYEFNLTAEETIFTPRITTWQNRKTELAELNRR